MPTSKPRKPTDFKKKKVVSAASAFKKAKKTSSSEVELPSGNVVRVKMISMTDLLSENIIPDTLTALVTEKLGGSKKKKAAKASDEEVRELIKNPKQLSDMFDVFDRIAAKVVLEPEFVYHRRQILDADGEPVTPEEWESIPDEERDEDLVYTDEVDLDDKSFLFQFSVGGTQDLERFRSETGAAVGELESGESVQPTTK